MTQTLDICIRGDGIVGRTLALLLARERLRVGLVTHLASAAGSAPDVRAYALNARSRALLESLRCWPDTAHATEVRQMQVWGDDGGMVQFDAAELGVRGLTWIVDVPALHACLADALRFAPQIELLRAPKDASLTVVCEGRASQTRAEFGVEFDVTPYPQTAIATRLQCEQPHGQVARQWFVRDEIVAFLPLDGAQGHSVAVVWSVPHARVPALLEAGAEDFCQQLHAASGAALGALTLQGARAAWPLQNARARRWVGTHGGQSWALAGDAAHNVHPLAGQGLNLGLADVATLAQVLKDREYWRAPGDLRLLRRYERARQADTWTMGAAMDTLQRLFALPGAPWQTARNWGMSGFDHSGPLKQWVARQAMGLA